MAQNSKTSTLFAPPSLPPQPQLCSSQTTRFAFFLHVSSALNELLSSTVTHRSAEKATGKYWQGRMHRRSLGGVRFCQNTLGSCFSAHPLRRTGTFPDPAAETRRVVDGPCAFASSDGRPFPFFACSTRKWWLDISHHNHMFLYLAVSISSFQSSWLHKRLHLLLQTSSRFRHRITVSATSSIHEVVSAYEDSHFEDEEVFSVVHQYTIASHVRLESWAGYSSKSVRRVEKMRSTGKPQA